MLRKLIKHEFKNTSMVMLTIYALLIVTTILGALALSSDAIHYSDDAPLILQLFSFGGIILYILSVFAFFIVTYVYICIHFYKTMYSEQGYLTHTLPVKPHTLLNAKFFTACIWTFGAMLLFILSIFGLIIGASRGEIITALPYIDFAGLQQDFSTVLGMNFFSFCAFMLLMLFFSCAFYIAQVYASISLGQLFNGHKIIGSIVCYIVLNFIIEILGLIVTLITGFLSYNSDFYYLTEPTFADILTTPVFIFGMLLSVISMVIFYFIALYMQKKHLNLD